MQFGGFILDGLVYLFEIYVGMLKKVVLVVVVDEEGVENEDLDSRNVRIVEIEYQQQVVFLGNVLVFVDEFLLCVVFKFVLVYQFSREELRVWRGLE